MKHIDFFRERYQQHGEQVIAAVEGWIGETMGKGKNTQQSGILVLSNQRLSFVRSGFVGSVFQSIALDRLSSVETRSFMGYNVATFHTSHNDLTFKSFSSEGLGKLVNSIEGRKRHSRNETPDETIGMYSELEMLVTLRENGELSAEEYRFAKDQILKYGSVYSAARAAVATNTEKVAFRYESTRGGIMSGAHAAGALLLFLAAGWFFIDGKVDEKAAPKETQKTASNERVENVKKTRSWDHMDICGRAVQTYFYIVTPPRVLDINGNTYSFEGKTGHHYNCRIEGERVALDWINLTGELMYSDSTRFSVGADRKLTVTTQDMTITYD